MASRTSYVSSSVNGLIVSNVCSRSHGHPPGARNRAINPTSFSNFSPGSATICMIRGMAPQPAEYPAYFGKYIDLVPPGDVTGILMTQIEGTLAILRAISD